MRELSIGEVAREAGVPASTLRYYEKAGLLPTPPRRSGQRRYTEAVLGRISLIRLAREAGFTIGETRVFLSGFSEQTPPAARWRALAARKLEEVNALMERAQRMKSLLETSFQCRCPRLEDCERYLRSARHRRLPGLRLE
jgi:MerR family redox-sensitive transcriptional activator SoxR